MSAEQIIFIVTAAISLGAAVMVVTTRNLIHAALWLVLTLFGVAVLFVLLDAGFFAIVQVIIYIGAISILLIFVIMLTRRTMQESAPPMNRTWWLAAFISVLLFAGLAWMLSSWEGFTTSKPELAIGVDPLQQLGQALVSPNAYVLPFEIASILLLAALIGAIVVAWEKKG
jgi:NADH-quinone oxidoreductase subunit J